LEHLLAWLALFASPDRYEPHLVRQADTKIKLSRTLDEWQFPGTDSLAVRIWVCDELHSTASELGRDLILSRDDEWPLT